MKKGLIHIYCGGGKGKTTAAMGLAMRMAGSGGKAAVFQFLKDNTSSERNALAQVDGIRLIDGMENVKFTFCMTDTERAEAQRFYSEKLSEVEAFIKSGEYDMIVLDEVLDAVESGIVPEERLLDVMKLCRGRVELVLTGRAPYAEVKTMADYITEMKNVCHPYDKGMQARKGIEF